MRRLIALGLALIVAGCSPTKTLEELEVDALRTGDWSLVEKREAVIAKRKARRSSHCPDGAVSYCDKSIGSYRCQCVAKAVMLDFLAAR